MAEKDNGIAGAGVGTGTGAGVGTGTGAVAGAELIDFRDARVRGGDHIVRGTAADGLVRAFAVTARDTVQTACDNHHASPLVTAALGRLMMGGLMMGAMSKDEDELITLVMSGDGPIGGLTVTANNKGQVKGYANHPNVWLDLKGDNHLDVGGGIGAGTLTVVRDLPGVEPYSSTVPLATGEVGDDLTYYFAVSDQIPTAVGVGVLVDVDLSVRQAGGFVVQLMPGYDDALIDQLSANLKGVESVTEMQERGMSPTDVLGYLLRGMGYEELDAMPAEFHCGCDKDRASRIVLALGRDELESMVEKGEPALVHCHFCGREYRFEPDELKALLDG
ncbi:MAG: Hsp33 family molecular chaperone HslO [Atopobiaceae bacterium]|nr:Hsp33 family molecular chaperone HslO [Atopobiaceae bacterium]